MKLKTSLFFLLVFLGTSFSSFAQMGVRNQEVLYVFVLETDESSKEKLDLEQIDSENFAVLGFSKEEETQKHQFRVKVISDTNLQDFDLNPDDIARINVIKKQETLDQYDAAGKNGIVEIFFKKDKDFWQFVTR